MRRTSLWSAVLTCVLFFTVSACHDTIQSPKNNSDSIRLSAEAAAPSHNAIDNHAPTANAGGPYTGLEGSPVALSAALSTDPDGDPLNYEWTIGSPCVSTAQIPRDCSAFLMANTSYTWPQNGTYTVQVKVNDGFGGTSTASAQVTISNVPPSVDSINVVPSALVNTSVTMTVRIKDPGTDSPWFVNVKWGDFAQTGVNVSTLANALTFTHTYAVAGNFTIEVAVADKDNAIGRSTKPIQIVTTLGNTPAGSAVKVQPADPTGAKPLTVTFPTVSTAGNTTLGVRQLNAAAPNRRFGTNPLLYDLATTAQFTGPIDVCLTYDPARFGHTGEARLMMLNGDQWTDITTSAGAAANTVCGQSAGVGTYAVALMNGSPVAVIASIAGINEGGSVTLDANGSSDPDGDAITYEWSFGDGSPNETTAQPSVSHTYPDNGTFTASVVARDVDAAVSTPATTSVVVANVAPTASLQAPASVNEGGAIALSLSEVVDPSSSDRAAGFSYAFDCGSGFGAWGTSASTNCATTDNGSRTVRAKVRDKDGGENAYDATVSIANVAPSATFQAPASVNEGSAFVLSMVGATDPSSADREAGLTYAFDCGSGFGAWGASASTSCATTDNGARTVRGKVRDKDGGEHAYDAAVSILNVAPTLGALQGPAGSVKKRTEVSVRGSFSDPGSSDTHSASITWGDGSSSVATIAGAVASGAHVYNTAGTYTVTMVVTDKDGGSSAPSSLSIVVANGNGNGNGNTGDGAVAIVSRGATVGTGLIATTTTVDKRGRRESSNGKFGFEAHSKTLRGRDYCDANINFATRDFDFKAKSCDSFTLGSNNKSVVIRGAGRLERDRGAYSYLLSVVDGGGRGQDRFRLKIWNSATGKVVFDNQPGAPMDAVADKKIDDGRIYVRDR